MFMKVFVAVKSFVCRNKKLFILGFVAKAILTISILGFSQNPKNGTEQVKIKTSAVCGMCKSKIESGLAFEKGIKDVNLDVKSKIATVTYKTNKTSPDKIRLAISKLGYDADEIPADKKAYDKLSPCCKKGNEAH